MKWLIQLLKDRDALKEAQTESDYFLQEWGKAVIERNELQAQLDAQASELAKLRAIAETVSDNVPNA